MRKCRQLSDLHRKDALMAAQPSISRRSADLTASNSKTRRWKKECRRRLANCLTNLKWKSKRKYSPAIIVKKNSILLSKRRKCRCRGNLHWRHSWSKTMLKCSLRLRKKLLCLPPAPSTTLWFHPSRKATSIRIWFHETKLNSRCRVRKPSWLADLIQQTRY